MSHITRQLNAQRNTGKSSELLTNIAKQLKEQPYINDEQRDELFKWCQKKEADKDEQIYPPAESNKKIEKELKKMKAAAKKSARKTETAREEKQNKDDLKKIREVQFYLPSRAKVMNQYDFDALGDIDDYNLNQSFRAMVRVEAKKDALEFSKQFLNDMRGLIDKYEQKLEKAHEILCNEDNEERVLSVEVLKKGEKNKICYALHLVSNQSDIDNFFIEIQDKSKLLKYMCKTVVNKLTPEECKNLVVKKCCTQFEMLCRGERSVDLRGNTEIVHIDNEEDACKVFESDDNEDNEESIAETPEEIGECHSCGWMCEYQMSHLRYSLEDGCRYIVDKYHFERHGDEEDVLFTNKQNPDEKHIVCL